MGAVITWLLNALKFSGPAAIGYFFNDLVSFIGKVTKQDPIDPTTKRPKIWVVVVALLLGGLAVFMVFRLLSGKKKLMSIAIIAGAAAFNYLIWQPLFPGAPEVNTATFLVILTTGAAVVTTANTTFVPKMFFYAAATQLTGVKITVQGDGVIFDSDANGLTHCGLNRLYGQVTNNYTFRIANGLIKGKNVLWEFTNSAAQTPSVYYDSDETPPRDDKRLYLQLLRQPALGPGGTDFSDFATLSFPSMAAADYANILYSDGTQQANMNRLDLQAMLQFTQNVVNTPIYQVDNWGGRVKKVNFQAVATQTAYVQRWVPPVSDGMLDQAIIAKG